MVAAAAIAGGVASAATGSLLNSALGPSSPNIPQSQLSGQSGIGGFLSAPDFTLVAPTFDFHKNGGAGLIDANAGDNSPGTPLDMLRSLYGFTGTTNDQLTSLLGRVDPAFGDLVNSQVQTIRNARDQAMSDLQGNLSQRRILGSSFGQDAATRTALDFANQEAGVRANGILQSIDAQSKLMQQRLSNLSAVTQQELTQANFSTSNAINLINGTQQTFADNSNILGLLSAQNAQGLGAASASIANGVGSLATKAINGFLTPSDPTLNVSFNTPNAQTALGGSSQLPGFD